MANGRDLTLGEIALASSVYGDAIDYGRIKIYSTDYLLTKGRISAPNGNIYFPVGTDQSSWYSDDISTHKLNIARGTFIHELGHVYQYQTGVSVKIGALLAGGDYDFTDKLKKGTPFSKWNIEEQSQFYEEMYYRSLGLQGRLPHLTNEQLNAVDDGGVLKIEAGGLYCFPASTPIQTSLTSTTCISNLRVGDTVLAFDPYTEHGRGALVPRRVIRLYRNTTTEWVKLSWIEAGVARELVATPGHHFLDQFGNFPPIAEMICDGGATVVLASGELAEVVATRIVYSAATAHLFEQAQSNIAVSGNTALKPQMLEGWQTYNFEVEDLHTYVAGGVRVHNISLYTPETGLGHLADQISGQISNHIWGANSAGAALYGSALSAVTSTAADAYQGRADFNAAHLGGRYMYEVAGSLGAATNDNFIIRRFAA